MKMYIHSNFGVLECTEMTLQAIENSIPEQVSIETIQDSEVSESLTDDSEVSPEVASEETTPDSL